MDINAHSPTLRHTSPYDSESNDSSSEVVEQTRKKQSNQKERRSTTSTAVNNLGAVKRLSKESIAKQLNAGPNLGLGTGMSEKEFREHAASVGLPADVCDSLVNDVYDLVKTLGELSEAEKDHITEKDSFTGSLKNLPADRSRCRQFKTTAAGGSLAYLTSFFFGKLALNLATIPTGTPHGAWAFLIAGLLNPLLSEPIVQGIRAAGAVYGSPDGKAYNEFHTASIWMGNAKDDPEVSQRWRKKMADIVTAVLKREESHGIRRLGSGIAEIKYDDKGIPQSAKTTGGAPIDPKLAEQKVIDWARRRAYITDEVPFFFFTLNYLISGTLAPTLKLALSPWGFFAADLTLSAFLGTLSGMETATLQNALRTYVQGAKLDAETPELKRAKLSAAYAKRTIYEEKMARLKQVRATLIGQWEALKKADKEGNDVRDELKRIRDCLRDSKVAYRSVRKQYVAIKRKFNQHNSVPGRIAQSVESSMGTYMGEVGLKPNSGLVQSTRFKAYSKLIGYPMSLIPVIGWSSYVVPWIVNSIYPVAGPLNPLNGSGVSGFNVSSDALDPEPAMAGANPGNSDERLQLQMALSALAGLPLIIGFTMRQQYLSRGIEWALAKTFGKRPVVSPGDSANLSHVKDRPLSDGGNDDSIVSWSDSNDDSIVSWSDSSDDDSEFSSDSHQQSEDEPVERSKTPARTEAGKANSGKDRVTSVPGMLSDDDSNTASKEDEHKSSEETESSEYV